MRVTQQRGRQNGCHEGPESYENQFPARQKFGHLGISQRGWLSRYRRSALQAQICCRLSKDQTGERCMVPHRASERPCAHFPRARHGANVAGYREAVNLQSDKFLRRVEAAMTAAMPRNLFRGATFQLSKPRPNHSTQVLCIRDTSLRKVGQSSWTHLLRSSQFCLPHWTQ